MTDVIYTRLVKNCMTTYIGQAKTEGLANDIGDAVRQYLLSAEGTAYVRAINGARTLKAAQAMGIDGIAALDYDVDEAAEVVRHG